MPTFAEIIDHATTSSLTTRKEIGAAGDVSVEAVRQWTLGTEPHALAVRRVVSRSSRLPDALKTELIDWFLEPSDFKASPRGGTLSAANLDPTNDRKIDARDVAAFSAQSIEQLAGLIVQLTEALCDGQMTNTERSVLRTLLHQGRDRIERALAALDYQPPGRVAQG